MINLDNIPQWSWTFFEIVVSLFGGIIIEHWFSVSQRATRFYYWAINKTAKLELSCWIESDVGFLNFKKNITSILRKQNLLDKIKLDTNFRGEIKLKEFNMIFTKHSQTIFILDIENERSGIRDLKDDLMLIAGILEELQHEDKTASIKNTSIDLCLPYKWKYLKVMPPTGYELSKYDVEYYNNKYKCKVGLNVQRVNFKNVRLSQMSSVLKDFTSVF